YGCFKDTVVLSLKVVFDAFFAKFGLRTSRVWGQGYDGASNMQREFNGLKRLNQKTTFIHPGNTRSGSHYGTLLNIIIVFTSIVDLLEIIIDDGLTSDQKVEVNTLLDLIHVLGITNDLSEALQRKDQDIVNAILLVRISKEWLQKFREDGWTSLSRRKAHKVTNMHHYRVELFYIVIGTQLQELNNRFNEVNTELLLCLIRLGQIYSSSFSPVEVLALNNQLETYIIDMRSNREFSNLKRIQVLSKKMVDTKKNIVYPLVYRLIKLVLILLVAISVERVVYAMKVVKNRLRNRIGDQLMNDCLITYVEKDIF
ncbi:hypothetical protein ERO13_D05G266650v2, partial [Gossypium hirsutum]